MSSAMSDLAMPSPPSHADMLRHLRQANRVAAEAREHGHHPFGAILVGPDGETVLLSQGNVSTVDHAESVLARRAFADFDAQTLWGSTLYTTVEPCVMCAGTQYWAHIGTLVFALTERELLAMTGNHAENPTMDMPCREVFQRGQKPVRVIGPVPELAEEVSALHRDFWKSAEG